MLMILVSLILLASSLYSAEASVFRKARESVMDAAAPVLEALSRPLAFVQQRIGDVRDYFNVLEKNQALREENAELRQWMQEALRLRAELKAYDRLQDFAADLETTPIDAFVIGESNDAFYRSMLVNAGAGDGVRRGMAVIDENGLIGRIVEVGKRSSRILLLTSVQSGIPVYVEETGLEGILKGNNGPRPVIDFAASTSPIEFKTGQRVVTSGAGGALPRGVAVGRLVAGRGSAPTATVDLYAKYAKARIVRVVNYQFPAFERSAVQDDPNKGPLAPLLQSTRPQPLQPPSDSPSVRAAIQRAEVLSRRSGRPIEDFLPPGIVAPGSNPATGAAPQVAAQPVATPSAATSQAAGAVAPSIAPPATVGLTPESPPPPPPPANDGD
ncbi:MAG: rod shape-determining protein MreC [Parvularculaceae bacterium]|nr:rod shape-determining protein MreC [Parvularculaceae bacterium]